MTKTGRLLTGYPTISPDHFGPSRCASPVTVSTVRTEVPAGMASSQGEAVTRRNVAVSGSLRSSQVVPKQATAAKGSTLQRPKGMALRMPADSAKHTVPRAMPAAIDAGRGAGTSSLPTRYPRNTDKVAHIPGMVQNALSAAKPSPCSIAKKISDTTASWGTEATRPPTRGPRRSTAAVPASVKPADITTLEIKSTSEDEPGESTKRARLVPGLEPPVLIPGGIRADALAGNRDLDQVRPVVARDALHAAAERRLQVLHGGDALAVHALRARQPDIVDRRGAEEEPRILALADHLAVGHLARPVVPHDLIALVVRDDGEHRGVVPGHGPEARRAIGQGAVAEIQHDGPLAADGDLGADGGPDAESQRAAAAARPGHALVPERQEGGAGGRALLNHDGVARQDVGEMRLEHARMHDRIVLVLAHEVLLAVDQELGVGAHLRTLTRPARDLLGRVEALHRLAESAQGLAHLALRGQIQRIVPAHQERVRPDLHHGGLGDGPVHALAPHEEEQVRPETRDLLEVLRHGIHAAVERMTRREVHEDLAAGEHRRLEQLGQLHRFRLRAFTPHVVAEHEYRTLGLAEDSGYGLDVRRARGARPLDRVLGAFPDLRLEPLAIEQLRADGEIDRTGGRRGGFAKRARGGHGDGRGVCVHLIGGARVLGDRPHGLRLAQAGEGCQASIVLELGRPVARDDQQRRARDLGIEELSGELVRPAHHGGDDDAALAGQAVIAVGHRRDQPFVLADHQPLIAILGDGREDPGLRGARVREEVLDPRVLQGLEEQHPARAGDGLSHGLPRCHSWLTNRRARFTRWRPSDRRAGGGRRRSSTPGPT